MRSPADFAFKEGGPVIHKNWQDLIKPNKLEVPLGDDADRTATVVAEPLERGFGLTLGNALRRVLLSSLQGAAVTAMHIDGVLHEFSSIPGVREDVTDLVLNVKDIAIKMQGDAPKRMVLKKQGPGRVTAGDIGTVSDIQILNPDLVLCTLDEGAEIRIEFTVATGKGYVPADRNRAEDAPIGLIPGRQPLFAGAPGQLSRGEHALRSGARLRQARHVARDGRLHHRPRMRLPMRRASCRTSSTSSSTSRSRSARKSRRRFPNSPSIRRCSRRWTNWSCRSARPTA